MQAAAACRNHRETELLAAVANGNRRAFEELYVIYHRRLLRFLLRLAPRHQIAEEVINDTFWIIWQKAKEFRGASRVSTWIMGIAYRRAMKMLRGERSGLPNAGSRTDAEDISIAEPDRDAEHRDWISQGLRQLPPEQRISIELAYYLGHSCEEIAQIMDCGVPTVKARMFHARQKLRLSLPLLAGIAANQRSRSAGEWFAPMLATVAIALVCLSAAVWLGYSASSNAPYRTVTAPTAAADGAVIRVVFAAALNVSEQRSLLESARLKIVAGPTAGGVYSLAPVASADPAAVESALAQLRTHAGVLFAEPVAKAPGE